MRGGDEEGEGGEQHVVRDRIVHGEAVEEGGEEVERVAEEVDEVGVQESSGRPEEVRVEDDLVRGEILYGRLRGKEGRGRVEESKGKRLGRISGEFEEVGVQDDLVRVRSRGILLVGLDQF